MTLDEAIMHCQEKSCSDTECAKEHKQLGEWLVELKQKKEQEKSVSEDLEKASKEWLRPQLDKSYANYGEVKMMELTHFDGYAMLDAIEFGAKLQKEQFEKNRLKHCNSITNEQAELEQGFIDQHLDKYNRMPTFLDAIEYGMRLQKEQIMEALLSEVLPYFMHGGESDEVVAKLEEVLNKKK